MNEQVHPIRSVLGLSAASASDRYHVSTGLLSRVSVEKNQVKFVLRRRFVFRCREEKKLQAILGTGHEGSRAYTMIASILEHNYT